MRTYRLGGETEFEELSGEVRRGLTITRLEPQPAMVLALLARRAGELVTHDEIRRVVWGDDTHVDFQDGVHYCIGQIRSALGDRARDPRLIVTVPKRGYRLQGDVLSSSNARPATWQRRMAIAGLIVALGAATAFVERRPNNHHETAVAVLQALHGLIY